MREVANLFYADMGFSLKEIVSFSKFWGLTATISRGVIGGYSGF